MERICVADLTAKELQQYVFVGVENENDYDIEHNVMALEVATGFFMFTADMEYIVFCPNEEGLEEGDGPHITRNDEEVNSVSVYDIIYEWFGLHTDFDVNEMYIRTV